LTIANDHKKGTAVTMRLSFFIGGRSEVLFMCKCECARPPIFRSPNKVRPLARREGLTRGLIKRDRE
jgi:hypothetical protein